jgi:hypothetical protein
LQDYGRPKPRSCWLDVCAAFIVEDADLGVHSEIVLTSDTFVGSKGFEDGADKTEYEIYLYDSSGNAIGTDGLALRLMVPAMQTTVVKVAELISPRRSFWGGMKVRLRPLSREPMHASDLFSSAFVRWQTADSFDNVHANPDPLEWQRPTSFYYSMPFPPLHQYESIFSLFNPYAARSAGTITLYDNLGVSMKELPYVLEPHSSLLLDLRHSSFVTNAGSAFRGRAKHDGRKMQLSSKDMGGTIAITNQPGSVKNFGYLVTKSEGKQQLFSVEHPIHQQPYKPVPSVAPFDTEGRFKAKNILYTPLVFHAKRIGGLIFNSRFNFSSGAPMEEALWLSPFVTGREGDVVWQANGDRAFPSTISSRQLQQGVLKLGAHQSCILDCSELGLPEDFAGGLSLPVAPNTNHTLMKVELLVLPWHAHAFTHFRPGLRSARSYQQARSRGGLSTDYIVTNASVERNSNRILRDEFIGILNIDDKGVVGEPNLEVFSSQGLIERIKIGKVGVFGCHHFLLSEFLFGKPEFKDLSLRLIDERATLLMSVIHLDYIRKDIALDHGSDRFSTFNDYGCDVPV